MVGGGGHATELWPRKDIMFYFPPTDGRTGVYMCEHTARMNGRHAAILSVLACIIYKRNTHTQPPRGMRLNMCTRHRELIPRYQVIYQY